MQTKKINDFISFLCSSASRAVSADSAARKFAGKHSGFFKFVKRRLDRGKFSGLPLTILSGAFVYILGLLLGAVEDIITLDPITRLDIRLANLFAAFRSDGLTNAFLWVTMLGKWQVIGVKTLLVSALLWLWNKRAHILPFWLTLFGTEVFVWLGKLALRRPRPETAVYTEHSFSFPSGHAAIAAAFYGFVIYILWRSLRCRKNKVKVLFVGLTIILSVGFSRMYLGVHYLSDVWGGYLTGALWVVVGVSVAEWRIRKNGDHNAVMPLHPGNLTTTSLALIGATFLLCIAIAVRYYPDIKSVSTTPSDIIVSGETDFFRARGLPKYTETPTGEKQEPLAFIIAATGDERLISAFGAAGWRLADKVSFGSVTRLVGAAALGRAYPTAPMTPSFWNKKTHNFGFEKPTAADNARTRHHARFWKTDFKTEGGKRIYVGTASLDIGMKWGVTHKIKPDIDTQREVLFNDLRDAGTVVQYGKEQFVDPVLGKNFIGDPFFTDGKIYIIEF